MNREHIAIHEAGHAVAHHRLNLEVNGARLYDSGPTGGSVLGPGADHTLNPECAADQVLAYLAGYAALKASGCSESVSQEGADSDFESVQQLIDFWGLGDIEHWKSKAVEMMSKPENVSAVRKVAEELLSRQHLPEDYALVLVDLSDGTCTEEEVARYRLLAGIA